MARKPDDLEAKSKVVSARVTPDVYEGLEQVLERLGETRSECIERLVIQEIERVAPEFFARMETHQLTQDYLEELLGSRTPRPSDEAPSPEE